MNPSELASTVTIRAEDLGHGPAQSHTRGWLVRRALWISDTTGLGIAFVATALIFGAGSGRANHLAIGAEYLLFALTLPLWLAAAKLYELYDRDEERTEHSTTDDFVGVLHLVTLGPGSCFWERASAVSPIRSSRRSERSGPSRSCS